MCAQKSNRTALIDGALRCLEQKPVGNITARDIAGAAGANLASIGYHFASKDHLVAHALAEGFQRWTAELLPHFARLAGVPKAERLAQALSIVRSSIERRQGFVRAYLSALSIAPYDEQLREIILVSYRQGRQAVGALVGLGSGQAADDAAALLMAAFDGLLIQFVLQHETWLTPERTRAALARLMDTLADWERA